jgi:hypothetical protein
MQKRIVAAAATETDPSTSEQGWLLLEDAAEVQITSEDSAHPIEAAFDPAAESGWEASQPGPQTIWLNFLHPISIEQIQIRFEISEERTQQFTLTMSQDGGVTYRELVRQQFNFSSSTRTEEENYFPRVSGVTDLKLTIVPNISGGNARATLRALRIRAATH